MFGHRVASTSLRHAAMNPWWLATCLKRPNDPDLCFLVQDLDWVRVFFVHSHLHIARHGQHFCCSAACNCQTFLLSDRLADQPRPLINKPAPLKRDYNQDAGGLFWINVRDPFYFLGYGIPYI